MTKDLDVLLKETNEAQKYINSFSKVMHDRETKLKSQLREAC
jgi:hypothetical protein